MPNELTSVNKGLRVYTAPLGFGGPYTDLLNGTNDPSVAGVPAPVGSSYQRSTTGVLYQKIGVADTDWAPLSFVGAFVAQPPVLIISSTAGIVDSHTPTAPTTYEWVVTTKNNVTGAYRSSKVLAVYDGSTVRHSVYQNIGIGTVSRTINVNLNAGTVELEVFNTGPNTLTTVVGRYPIIET